MQVTWEDQQNINAFSKLNTRRHDLGALIAGVKVRGRRGRRRQLPRVSGDGAASRAAPLQGRCGSGRAPGVGRLASGAPGAALPLRLSALPAAVPAARPVLTS